MDWVGAGGDRTNTSKPSERRLSGGGIDDGDVGDTCRICRGEGTLEQPLFYPCKCSGSIRYVHQECLLEWLSHSQKKYCELCKTSFRFTKLYHQSMPDVLPLPLFIRQVALYGARTVAKWLRYVLVITVWACFLPWTIRQVWRGLFWLADGSWLSKHEMQLLQDNGTFSGSNNATQNATLMTFTTASRGHSTSHFSSFSDILSVLTGDALLRGLLRLVTSKAFSVSPLMTNINNTSNTVSSSSQSHRRPSLLSDMQSLNSFTRHVRVNNTLIDVLEGQLVCLCVIAAFILVFLIREWVINQQPVHMMPDPDQGDVAPVLRAQNDDARQGIRRRRPNARRVVAAERQPAHALDVDQRPRAVPRQRRLAVPEHIPDHSSNDGANHVVDFPARTSSLPQTVQANEDSEIQHGLDIDPASHGSQNASLSAQDLQSPPLERGIFDDAVSIRRSIEERSSFPHSGSPERESTMSYTDGSDSSVQSNLRPQEPSVQAFDFAAFASRNEAGTLPSHRQQI